jgi:hypothetical protein
VNNSLKLLLVSAWFVACIAFLASNIWGRMTERTYDARTRLRLMPGRLRDRDVWVRSQKTISWFGMFFVVAIYVLCVIGIFS